MQNNYNKLINNLNDLNLTRMAGSIGDYLEFINKGEKNVVDSLYELTEMEMKLKQKRAMDYCVKVANFPYLKEFVDFDFSFQPSVNKEQLLDFQYLKFLEKKENIVFVGSPGVGKTHLATSIGIAAAKQRVCTYFISCNDLMLQLKRARIENRLDQRIKFFCKYKLLVIDEVGFLPLDIESSNLFFQLIAKRYEKTSTIITTNKPLSKWGEIFGDNVLANAILDRLLHHSHIINIVGKSYRTKDIFEDKEEDGVISNT